MQVRKYPRFHDRFPRHSEGQTLACDDPKAN
jgi:hypothetical protein